MLWHSLNFNSIHFSVIQYTVQAVSVTTNWIFFHQLRFLSECIYKCTLLLNCVKYVHTTQYTGEMLHSCKAYTFSKTRLIIDRNHISLSISSSRQRAHRPRFRVRRLKGGTGGTHWHKARIHFQNMLRLWHREGGQLPRQLRIAGPSTRLVLWTSDARALSCADSCRSCPSGPWQLRGVQIWQLRSGECVNMDLTREKITQFSWKKIEYELKLNLYCSPLDPSLKLFCSSGPM